VFQAVCCIHVFKPKLCMHFCYPRVYLMPRAPCSFSFDHPDDIWRVTQIVKLLIELYSSAICMTDSHELYLHCKLSHVGSYTCVIDCLVSLLKGRACDWPPSVADLPIEVKVSCGLAMFAGRLRKNLHTIRPRFSALLSHLEITCLCFKTLG
jgi:hypothetical protein